MFEEAIKGESRKHHPPPPPNLFWIWTAAQPRENIPHRIIALRNQLRVEMGKKINQGKKNQGINFWISHEEPLKDRSVMFILIPFVDQIIMQLINIYLRF